MNSACAAMVTCVLALSLMGNERQPAVGQRYEAPTFADSARLEKARALFPEIERIYREFAISNHFPGVAFGVVIDGKLVFSGSYGVAELSGKTPVTEDTLFRIASMSKSFTAMAILQLRDAWTIQSGVMCRK